MFASCDVHFLEVLERNRYDLLLSLKAEGLYGVLFVSKLHFYDRYIKSSTGCNWRWEPLSDLWCWVSRGWRGNLPRVWWLLEVGALLLCRAGCSTWWGNTMHGSVIIALLTEPKRPLIYTLLLFRYLSFSFIFLSFLSNSHSCTPIHNFYTIILICIQLVHPILSCSIN